MIFSFIIPSVGRHPPGRLGVLHTRLVGREKPAQHFHGISVIWLELIRHTVSVQAYSTASSWHFLLLMSCTPAVMGWGRCWIFTKVLKFTLDLEISKI